LGQQPSRQERKAGLSAKTSSASLEFVEVRTDGRIKPRTGSVFLAVTATFHLWVLAGAQFALVRGGYITWYMLKDGPKRDRCSRTPVYGQACSGLCATVVNTDTT
jgi:hypothetical protein